MEGARGATRTAIATAFLFWIAVLPPSRLVLGSTESEPRPGESDLTERVTVSLVLVEAVVLDRSGRHVKGLPREAFTVLEDGREVVIASFDEIAVAHGSPPPAAPSGDAAPTRPPKSGSDEQGQAGIPIEPWSPTRGAGESERRFVFLFDGYNNASPLRLVQARRAAKQFIRSKMRPGDLGAVYEVSPFLRSIVPLTADRDYLEDSIDDIRYFPGESLGKQIIDSSVYNGIVGSRATVQERILGSAEFGASQAAAEQRQYFRSLEGLGNILEDVPGRKIVVLFSGGFPIMVPKEDVASGGFTHDFETMIRQLEKSRVSVYGIYIGEEARLTDATQRTNLLTELDQLGFGSDFLDRMGLGAGSGGDTTLAYNQFVAVLSHESGGRFFPGYDYGRSLSTVADDTAHFYLIGYEPPEISPGQRRHRYRMIEVRVDRKGVRVTTRSGRFAEPERVTTAPKDVSATSKRAVRRPSGGAEEPVEEYLLSSSPVYFPGGPGRTLVVLPVMLSGPVMPVERLDGGFGLDISTRLIARSAGVEIERRERDYRVGFDDPILKSALERGLRLTDAVEIPPGDYELEVWVRLNGLGVEATWRRSATVPGFDTGSFSISGLSLLADDSAPPLVADVFTADRNDPPPAPNAGDDPLRLSEKWRAVSAPSSRVDRMQPLMCLFRVHNPALTASGSPDDLSVEYSLVPEAGGLGLLLPTKLLYFERRAEASSYDAIARLDLRAVEPGAYRLRIAARDGEGREAVQERSVVVTAYEPLDRD